MAEVLITLAIIGVVATLTIPTLVQSYKKKVTETRLLKFYSTMNNAIELSEIDNGPKEFWTEFGSGYETDENGTSDATKPKVLPYLNEYILPYLKSAKIDIPKDKVMAGFVKVYFNDGSLALMSGASIIFYPSASDYSEISEYIEGDYWRRDDVKNRGIKSFTFFFNPSSTDSINKYHYAKGVEPYAFNWNGDIDQLKNHNTIGCKETVSNERAFCTKLIQLNNWKIPDDYPFKL